MDSTPPTRTERSWTDSKRNGLYLADASGGHLNDAASSEDARAQAVRYRRLTGQDCKIVREYGGRFPERVVATYRARPPGGDA